MEALEQAIGHVAPVWRPHEPNGGFIASELKRIHDESLSVFPESVYSLALSRAGESEIVVVNNTISQLSQHIWTSIGHNGASIHISTLWETSGEGRRKGRWLSTMREDYIPIHAMTDGAMRKPPVVDECGVQGTLCAQNNVLFQKWKVPSHVTESQCSSGRGTRMSMDQLSELVEDVRLESPTRSHSGLPNITGATPRPGAVNSALVLREPSKRAPRQRQPKSLAAKTLMETYHIRDQRSMAQRWMDQASDADKKMVAKALKVNEANVTNQEDVTEPVKKWLKGASPKERDVALAFFQSLAGTQLMGGSMDKKDRVDQVIGLLRNPPNKYATENARACLTSGQRHRHLNILTPTTRKNKWHHQTWHHLPLYPNKNKVLNKSSILIEPHSTVHRHFTIHPDWGP